MRGIAKARMQELVKRVAEDNPYKVGAIRYFVGSETRYIYAGESMTEQELDDAYAKTAEHDICRGYADRMVGYYDKWYRYCHADEGRAYDIGVSEATMNPKCESEFHVIECIH